jgi:hypothetical protein
MATQRKTCRICRFERSTQLRLREESGTTDHSLHNAHVLISKYGLPDEVELFMDDREGTLVDARWENRWHQFSGFSWGYGGTGPHGLVNFLNELGVHPEASIEQVMALPTPSPRRHRGAHDWWPRPDEGRVLLLEKGTHYGETA